MHSDLDCDVSTTAGEAITSCAKGVLTVNWPTVKAFNASYNQVPADLKQRIDERLIAKGSMLQIVLLQNKPP